MNWLPLHTEEELQQLVDKSAAVPQVIFKYSTRCPLSATIKNRLERATAPAGVDFHFLDLIAYRSLSNKIADDFSVRHESPQVLLIRNGKSVYAESHTAISMDEITEQLQQHRQ